MHLMAALGTAGGQAILSSQAGGLQETNPPTGGTSATNLGDASPII